MSLDIERMAQIFDKTIVGIAQVKLDGSFFLVNDRYCEIVGRRREELLKLKMQEITHPDDLKKNLLLFQEIIRTGKSFEIEKRYIRPDHSITWVRNHVTLLRDENGAPFSVFAVTVDITEQKADAARREVAEKRNKFLAEVSLLLSSSLDFNLILDRITRLAVPDFGDWCYIHLKNNEGQVELSKYFSLDPKILEPLEEFATISARVGEQNAVSTVIRTSRPVMRNGCGIPYYEKVSATPRQFELFCLLAPQSVIVVPLKSLGKLLGTITIAYTRVKDYTDGDLDLLQEVAIRAGLAIDNALLYRESKKAIASRDEFLSLASHELKTPLTSLTLLNQMTLKKIDRPDFSMDRKTLKEVFTNYEAHISRIARLVDDMLDITHIQLGSYKLNLSDANVEDSVTKVCDHLLPQIEKANCSLALNVQGDLRARFDISRIEQVLTNIVSNAFKYAAGGKIYVTVWGDENAVTITVKDEGFGVAKASLKRIFERFERATSPSSVSGLGLGLYISQKILEAHGGKIWGENEPQKGTSFTIELPKKGPGKDFAPRIS